MFRFILALIVIGASISGWASSEGEHSEGKKGFDAGAVIMHHIMDAHEIHLFTLNEGSEHEKHVSIPLPIILYSKENGLDVFMSSKLAHGHSYKGYVMSHEKIYFADEHGHVAHDEHGTVTAAKPMDFSITKTVAGVWVAIVIMIWMFVVVARAYKRRPNAAPRGLQSALEPLILFVRDEIAKPSIGEKRYKRYMPFLLTIFFFIWISNMLGLIPFIGGFNVTGNIAIAMVLAIFTFVITIFSGNKDYWMHIFWTPGVPWWLKVPVPLMFIIEFIGFLSKPIVLTLRLFANITAGHIIILSFVSLIFIFTNIYGAGAGYGVSVLSVGFSIFMFCIELLVAFLQAYVFTLLSAIYFGSAVEEHEHAH